MNFSTNELVVKKSLLLIALFLDALHASKKYTHVIFRLHKVLWMWKSKIVAISCWLKVRSVTLHGHTRAYMSGQVPRPTNVGSLQLFNNWKSSVFVISMPFCLRWRRPILVQSTTFRRMVVRFASKFIQLFIIPHHFSRASQPGDRRLTAARWNLPKTCSRPGRRASTAAPFLSIIGFNLMWCHHQNGGDDGWVDAFADSYRK